MNRRFPLLLLATVIASSPTTSFAADTSRAAAALEAEALQPSNLKPFAIPEEDKPAHDHWAQVVKAYMNLPAEQVTAHPSAADFPGAVPDDAPRIAREFDVTLNLPRWHSTGLYAPPGAKVIVQVDASQVKRGLQIVIGPHRDDLNRLAKWPRFPKISRSFPINEATTTVANAFGGLIYIDVPRDAELGGHLLPTYGGYGWLDEHPSVVSGSVHIKITGAVEAPLYQLGKTSPTEWRRMRELTAPWGELASGKIILTVPTYMLKAHDDPASLLQFWGRVVDAEAELAGWPAQPAPPERIVADREISAGFMHSGYPIMCHLGSAVGLLKLEKLQSAGDWGFFHELGHNHEAIAYTFDGHIEVCVNLYSMYVMQTLCHQEITATHGLNKLDTLLRERLSTPPKTGPWNDLAMYILPIQALGWKPLHNTLATYAKPGGTDGIKTNDQKMDQFVLRYSRAAGRNLAPYFEPFGITCTPATLAQIKSLPVWLPDGFPGKYTQAAQAAR